ncbi:MAG: NAD(P)-dependent oxidoreductase [Acidimicrobiia bacterium]
MGLRVINQMGAGAAALIANARPDVELIEFAPGDPPAGLAADVFFGGYFAWDDIARWIDAAGVRWVQTSGTGVDKVPRSIFDGRVVTCARGASAVPISEWVMAAVLAWAKRMPQTWLHEPPRHWNFPSPAFDSMANSTLALVGFGGIGTAIARRALAFDMNVVALRRTDAPSPVPGVRIVRSMTDLVADADHLVLAAPATPKTQHLVNADVLAEVKAGVHLVNIARGALVDHEALRLALDDGRVANATLDTVEPEPTPEGHWLYSHPQVRLSAHVSWYTPDLQRAAVDIFVDNLGRFARGEPLREVVDPDEGY